MKNAAELRQLFRDTLGSMRNGGTLKAYLRLCGRMRQYETVNTVLIFAQRPDAVMAERYGIWKHRYGRQVRKGEKALRIFAPEPDRVISVFDLSQTAGNFLPEALDGMKQVTDDPSLLCRAVKLASPFAVHEVPFFRPAEGYCRMKDRMIVIRSDLSETDKVFILLRESARALLYACGDPSAGTAENRSREAEYAAYIAGTILTGQSFEERILPDVPGDPLLFAESLERSRDTAFRLISCTELVRFPCSAVSRRVFF